MTSAPPPFDSDQPHPLPPRATIDGERLISVFSSIVEPLGRAFPVSSEVVLHDLGKLPNSIVAIHGDVTGRRIGDPATDLLLEMVAEGEFTDQVNYETRLPDGRRIQSSTMIIRDVAGYPVAALCVNTDISAWLEVIRIAEGVIDPDSAARQAGGHSRFRPAAAENPSKSRESFPRSVEELAEQLMQEAIGEIGIEVADMKKEHKLRAIQTLRSKGFFMLKGAPELIAERLAVTRFTIYNYLNETAESPDKATAAARSPHASRRAGANPDSRGRRSDS